MNQPLSPTQAAANDALSDRGPDAVQRRMFALDTAERYCRGTGVKADEIVSYAASFDTFLKGGA